MYQFVTNTSAVETLFSRYPACSGTTVGMGGEKIYVIVNAALNRQWPEERAALLNMVFGVSGWAGLVVNLIVVEWYLNSTLEEDERLRKVSAARRRAAGLEKA